MRILVVDDDLTGRVLVKAILASHGDVDSAPNGDLALRMIEEAIKNSIPYDLITMDIGLPDIDGPEVVQVIRELEQRNQKKFPGFASKILMITEKADPKNIMASFNAGCEDYIVKPVTPEKLDSVLASFKLLIGS